MKAIRVVPSGSKTTLHWDETPEPVPGPDEVLLDIYAAGVNRADLLQRDGGYPPPPGAPDILGLEASGVIAETGPDVSGWSPGDRACTLLSGGGYAERICVSAALLMPIPATWTFVDAAALPEVFFTAFVNLFTEAALQPGESVLVHGGASGVGTAAIQLAREAGCAVIATAGTDEKVARCEELGAAPAINYNKEDFVDRVDHLTTGRGVDVILDMVGGDYFQRNIRLLAPLGRLVIIATLGGRMSDIDLGLILSRRLRVIGSTLRSRPLAEKIEIRNRFTDRFWDRLESGVIRPVLDRSYDIRDAGDAHERMSQNANIGKIVLKVRD